MAVHGTLVSPISEVISLDLLMGIPTGDLIDVILTTSIDSWSSILTNRFPTPPTAGGFLTEVEALLEDPIVHPYPGVVKSISGILSPMSDILEPNVGQIWPR